MLPMPATQFPVQYVARKAHNPRNGNYYSLRVIAREGSDGTEFCRIRRERNGWNAWADDRDFDRLLKFHLRNAKTLNEALECAKRGLIEWEQ